MNLSDLQGKDIVDLIDGKRIGNIIDAVIDESGKIASLTVQKRRFFSLFSNTNNLKIKWEQIDKIGEDVILVNLLTQ